MSGNCEPVRFLGFKYVQSKGKYDENGCSQTQALLYQWFGK